MSDNDLVQAAEALLDAFRQQVPPPPERPPTFMEITRYPHYEDVCSNILAFFFDPSKPHGLGRLFLDALVRVGGIEGSEGRIGVNVRIDREKYTEAGNRIDILIQSDSHAILIENKIYHDIANPFADYAKHLDSFGQRHKHKFLLTRKPVSESIKRDIEGFRNITHENLVKKIRRLLGGYVAKADTRYLTFMLDFLNTLDYLQGGMVMNPEFVKFLAEHEKEAARFFNEVKAFKSELSNKIKGLQEIIDISSYDKEKVRQLKYYGEPRSESLFGVLAHDIKISSFENNIVVEPGITPEGWTIEIWLRNKSDGGSVTDSGKREKLLKLLDRLNISLADNKSERFVMTRFAYEANLEEIAEEVLKAVGKLAPRDDAS